MDERRREDRHPPVLQAEIRDRQSGEVLGLLADISTGGMMLRAEQPLRPRQKLNLAVELPGTPSPGVTVDVTVRWSEPDLDPSIHLIGLSFTGKTPPDNPQVLAMVKALKSVK